MTAVGATLRSSTRTRSAQSFGGERVRVGAFAIGWLYAIALLLGLGIGPTIGYFLENDGTIVNIFLSLLNLFDN